MQIEQLCASLNKVCNNPALSKHPQVQHAAGVLKEYLDYHAGINYELSSEIRKRIEMALSCVSIISAKQLRSTPSDFFAMSKNSYSDFTHSRRSVRNFNKLPVSRELLLDAIAIAQSSPSSCNRQISRVHIYQDRQSIDRLLDIQSGARGWSQLVPCLLVVTGDLRMCTRPYERDMIKVDGGMYAMNLLLALHYLKLAACPLNCYLPNHKENKVREAGLIPNNQSLVMMIACGHPADVFELAASPRRSADEVSFFHQ
jgi:nitroreductase